MLTNENDNKPKISMILNAIKQASDSELKVLSEISANIKKMNGSTLNSSTMAANDSHTLSSATPTTSALNGGSLADLAIEDTQQKNDSTTPTSSTVNTTNITNITNNNPTVISNASDTANNTNTVASASKPKRKRGRVRAANSKARKGETLLTSSNSSNSLKDSVSKSTGSDNNEVVTSSTNSTNATDSIKEIVSTSKQPEISASKANSKTAKVQDKTTKSLDKFAKYWKDEKGRLRKENGQYASKAEQQAYSNSADVAKSRENDKQQTALGRLLGVTTKAVTNSVSSNNSDLADTAGAAGGSTYFYAAKEIVDLAKDGKEQVDNLKNSQSKVVGSIKSIFTKKQDNDDYDKNTTTASETAQENKSSQQIEAIQEQTDEQKQSTNEIIAKLDDLDLTSSSGGGNSGGVLDSISDYLDGDGKKGRKRKGRRSKKLGKRGFKKSGSLLGKVMNGAKGIGGTLAGGLTGGLDIGELASGGLSMAGGAFKGVSTLAKTAGKAVPFLAPIMAAVDGFQGFTDTQGQKDTFGLKDGQDATMGQKSSFALGNILDMGGIVSGGAGLVGDLLGSLGFDGAQEALNFDSGDISKSIYNLFGGDSDNKEPVKPEKAQAQGSIKETKSPIKETESPIEETKGSIEQAMPVQKTTPTSSIETAKTVDNTSKTQGSIERALPIEQAMPVQELPPIPQLNDKLASNKVAIAKPIASKEAPAANTNHVSELTQPKEQETTNAVVKTKKIASAVMNNMPLGNNDDHSINTKSLSNSLLNSTVATSSDSTEDNTSINAIKAANKLSQVDYSDKNEVAISLDSIKELAKGITSSTEKMTSTTNNNKSKETVIEKSKSKGASSIVTDFSDQSLRLLSLDLE